MNETLLNFDILMFFLIFFFIYQNQNHSWYHDNCWQFDILCGQVWNALELNPHHAWNKETLSFWSIIVNVLPSGLCLEKVPAASPSLSNKNTGSPSSIKSTTDREQEIITCYEKSGDIALLYLQEAEKVQLHKFLFFSPNFVVWKKSTR